MNSYLNDKKAINRLKKEYLEHKNLIIGFDFDCTIYDYHKEELDLQPVIDLLKKCNDLEFTMCLYSLCHSDYNVRFKEKYLKDLGINIKWINDSPVLKANEQAPFNKTKPYFNILLDDRAGLSAAYNILKTTLEELEL